MCHVASPICRLDAALFWGQKANIFLVEKADTLVVDTKLRRRHKADADQRGQMSGSMLPRVFWKNFKNKKIYYPQKTSSGATGDRGKRRRSLTASALRHAYRSTPLLGACW